MRYKMWMTAAIIGATALVMAPGCGSGDGTSKINDLLHYWSGPSSTEMMAMSYDLDDADRRRKGVVGLAKKDWAARDQRILNGFADIAKNDPDASVRSAAVRALGSSGDSAYVDTLAAALSDISTSVRWDAAVALDQNPGQPAIAPLSKRAIGDNSLDVRMACAKSLRHYREKQVVRTLVMCLEDREFGVRYAAHRSLVEITGSDRGAEYEDWLSAVGDDLPPAKPVKAKKSRWAWLGVRGDKSTELANGEKQ